MTSNTPTSEFERGARAAVEALGLYFVDEDQRPIYEELGTTTFESFAENAVADTLADEAARVKRAPATDSEDWDETNLRAELAVLRSELDDAHATTLWGIRHVEAHEGNADWTAEDEGEARYEQENFGGQLISRTAGDWAVVTSPAGS